MTPAEIIYDRRVRLLPLADELGNISAACRQMGISRNRYYEWRGVADYYGCEGEKFLPLSALIVTGPITLRRQPVRSSSS